MTATPIPVSTLPLASEEKNLLTIVQSGGACCGGSSCAID